jgi:hypothetical protein
MTRDILEMIQDLQLDINRDEVREIEHYLNCDDDFYVEIDGEEYRFINEDAIWDIYVEGIQAITEECFTGKLDWWIAIDWEETAENCLQADGYGQHFASYDGNEHEYKLGEENYYIFRTN